METKKLRKKLYNEWDNNVGNGDSDEMKISFVQKESNC